MLAGALARLGNFGPGGRVERKFLNDAIILLQARLLGASVLTANITDFDYLNQLVPDVRIIVYQQ